MTNTKLIYLCVKDCTPNSVICSNEIDPIKKLLEHYLPIIFMHLPALWHFSRMSEQLGNSTHPQVPPDDKTFTIYLNGITITMMCLNSCLDLAYKTC